jgi:predicted dehydrogenase
MKRPRQPDIPRRAFLSGVGAAGATLGLGAASARAAATAAKSGGAAKSRPPEPAPQQPWQPVSDRRVRVGIVGYGLCKFGAQFFFQTHPNVEVAAVSDLDPGRCAELAKACGCGKTYASCEELVQDDSIEAVFLATDAPSHAPLAIHALRRGKHVASAVPAVFGANALEDAAALLEAVKSSGRRYMMFETSTFHADCHGWRRQYRAGALGKLIYAEGEYYHYKAETLGSYNPRTGRIDEHGWRRGLPPMWYPTHATAYYVSVSGGRFVAVSCLGTPSLMGYLQPGQNAYGNRFGTEIALLRTSEGGMARMAVSWDMPLASGEKGRVYGEKLGYEPPVDRERPPLPPRVAGGGHGGSHGYLANDFIESILLDRRPIVDVADALNMTLAGVIAHQSALREGEWMKIPRLELA